MTLKQALSIQMGNIEDAWSSSDESNDIEVVNLYSQEQKDVENWKKNHNGEMPREHHSW